MVNLRDTRPAELVKRSHTLGVQSSSDTSRMDRPLLHSLFIMCATIPFVIYRNSHNILNLNQHKTMHDLLNIEAVATATATSPDTLG
jgi:hypothetical protein